MEIIHSYIYSEEKRTMHFQRPNLCLESSDIIRISFEMTAQEPAKVFSNVPIRRILDITILNFSYKAIKYARYTIEKEDGRIYTFTDADLINLYAYDLPHLYSYLSKRMEMIREYSKYLRRVVNVMREHIRYNYQTDFDVGLQPNQAKKHLPRNREMGHQLYYHSTYSWVSVLS